MLNICISDIINIRRFPGVLMSDTPDRRYEDKRLDKIDTTIDTMQGDITYIKTKIDNGFSTSIKSTEDKVNYIDERNREEHHDLIESIKNLAVNSEKRNNQLSKKLDKILFLWLGGSISVCVAVAGFIIREAITH